MNDPHYLLVLWFVRDLTDSDRASLLRIYGKGDLETNNEQQQAFRKILLDAAEQARRITWELPTATT